MLAKKAMRNVKVLPKLVRTIVVQTAMVVLAKRKLTAIKTSGFMFPKALVKKSLAVL